MSMSSFSHYIISYLFTPIHHTFKWRLLFSHFALKYNSQLNLSFDGHTCIYEMYGLVNQVRRFFHNRGFLMDKLLLLYYSYNESYLIHLTFIDSLISSQTQIRIGCWQIFQQIEKDSSSLGYACRLLKANLR